MHLPNQFTFGTGGPRICLEALLSRPQQKKKKKMRVQLKNKEWLQLFLRKTDYFCTLWMCFGKVLLATEQKNVLQCRTRCNWSLWAKSGQLNCVSYTSGLTVFTCAWAPALFKWVVFMPVLSLFFLKVLNLLSILNPPVINIYLKVGLLRQVPSTSISQFWSWRMCFFFFFLSVTSASW